MASDRRLYEAADSHLEAGCLCIRSVLTISHRSPKGIVQGCQEDQLRRTGTWRNVESSALFVLGIVSKYRPVY